MTLNPTCVAVQIPRKHSPASGVNCRYLDYHTSTVYNIPFQALCVAQIMPQARSLQEFAPLAREAFLAFFSGYRASSISALIPAIEGSLARIVSSVGTVLQIHEKASGAVDGAIGYAAQLHFDQMWVPREYLTTEYLFGQDERVFIFETFRRWLQRSFFCNTGEYDGATWLNRHLFAHGSSSLWQQSANFSRIVVALTTVGAIESWHDQSNRVSLFFPEMNDDGKLYDSRRYFRQRRKAALSLSSNRRIRSTADWFRRCLPTTEPCYERLSYRVIASKTWFTLCETRCITPRTIDQHQTILKTNWPALALYPQCC
ncbi:hypothetical protein [Paraburkholderia sp. CNPSo 3281]|uniref:hypothetical protein n=1 Tax=Paraburkholderia sp. CNPSo 3281 TaxID=2940933 RepID=UPI0020B8D92C|nr:hypothetical protein [Paraburkholderia sp. CNPSo 3281]MCP3715413.1 hypothetical protein [Paraburkholderia sp. CNPSo 3281]